MDTDGGRSTEAIDKLRQHLCLIYMMASESWHLLLTFLIMRESTDRIYEIVNNRSTAEGEQDNIKHVTAMCKAHSLIHLLSNTGWPSSLSPTFRQR